MTEVTVQSDAEATAELRRMLADKERRIAALEHELELALAGAGSKCEFVAGMGHELLTPLNGIIGMTELVLETELGEKQRERLEMVSSSADRLLEVVRAILDFCRIESGTLQLDRQDFRLTDCLDLDLSVLQITARQKGLDFEVSIDDRVPSFVNTDPDRLVQVIGNLVDNAITFTEAGTISIALEHGGEDERGRVLLKVTVTDTGIGIPPEEQQIITANLARDSHEYDRKYWGGGLGLITSAQLVRLAGGEIGLASTPGAGTTVWFTWACARAAAEDVRETELDVSGGEAAGAGYGFEGSRVLLAEDEPISRILIETLLEQAGLQVAAVDNGGRALEEAVSGEYQAVLMDVQMPVLNGLEATQRIRDHERDRGGHLPIIALTAHTMQGDRERCLQAGMDDYLTKPLNKAELFTVLHEHLTQSALVFDGDPEQRERIIEFLVGRGWRVTLAETGRSAMYEASLTQFDLILLDLDDRAAEGPETARMIRELETFSGRRALILGLASTPDRIDPAQPHPADIIDAILERPLDLSALQDEIDRRY